MQHESFLAIDINFKITAAFHIVKINKCESPPQTKRSCNLKRFVKMKLFRLIQKERKGGKRAAHQEEKGEIVERGFLEIAVALSMTGIETSLLLEKRQWREGVRSDYGILK